MKTKEWATIIFSIVTLELKKMKRKVTEEEREEIEIDEHKSKEAPRVPGKGQI
jgi:hypothetical protein